MKKWTVVIEITDSADDIDALTLNEIEGYIYALMINTNALPLIGFRIMETIEAPYGPQHPNGVFIKEVESKIMTHGSNKECPSVQSGSTTHCPGHKVQS